MRIFLLLFLLAFNANAAVFQFFTAATSNGTSAVIPSALSGTEIQATVSGSGVVTATVQLYGSMTNSASGGVLLATISLYGTTSASDGATIPAKWPFIYAVLTNLSGTGAAADVRARS